MAQAILLQSVETLGERGDVVDVAPADVVAVKAVGEPPLRK